MIDFKKTLTNLHDEFPEFDLDTLFKIIDAIVETPTITIPSGIRQPSDKPWYENDIIELLVLMLQSMILNKNRRT